MVRVFRSLVIGVALLAVGAAVALFVIYQSWNPAPPAAQLFKGGPILTVNDNNEIAAALLVVDDKIAAVGTEEEVMAAAPAGATIIDLGGKTLMPGIVDAHGHYPGWGVFAVLADLASPPVGTITSIAEMQARLAAMVEQAAPGEWVGGMGYDDTLMADMRHPTAADLDAVSPDNPMVIIHVSGHMMVVNSLAMELMGVTRDTPDPEGGEIVKGADGEPTGLMLETASYIFKDKVLGFTPLQILSILQAGNKDYLSKGVTTVQNGLSDKSMFMPLGLLAKIGYTPVRVSSLVEANYALELAAQGELYKNESDMYHVAGVKIVTDGSIQGYTGFLGAPYHIPHHDHGAAYRGYPTLGAEKLNDLVIRSMDAGLRPFMHGNGDASIDMILDAVDAAQTAQADHKDMWPVIIHAQMIRRDQIARAKGLNVSPSFFNAHVYYWGDRHKAIFMGPRRADRMSPMAEALAADLPFTIHLDTPVVPMTPWLMIWSAVSRTTSGGDILGADQVIGLDQAIRATTIDAAWQAGMADKIGSIEVGKYADLIILDQNPYATDDLRSIKVLTTIVGGVERYSASQ